MKCDIAIFVYGSDRFPPIGTDINQKEFMMNIQCAIMTSSANKVGRSTNVLESANTREVCTEARISDPGQKNEDVHSAMFKIKVKKKAKRLK